jgi:hypothetical protein
MAKKISAIVIPAVIDTTGIDKGINSIKTKLSGVRGSIGTRNSGTGGVGGGGNFGAGLPHYGGSAVAVGAAAAIGGAAGGSRAKTLQEKMSTSSAFARDLRNSVHAQSNRFSRYLNNLSNRSILTAVRWSGKLDDSGAPPGSEEFVNRARNIRLMANASRGLNQVAGATGRAYIKADFGGDNGTKMSYARSGALLGGTLAVANQMRKQFTRGGIKQNFSDLSNLEGNRELYERAAAIKRRTFGPSGMPTFAQSMVLGAEEFRGKGGGAGDAENLASKTDTLIAKTGNLLGQSLESSSGIILNAYDNFRNSPWGGGIKMIERLGKIFT